VVGFLLLERQRNLVHEENENSQQDSSGFSEPQRGTEEAQCRAMVHGSIGNAEWESGDPAVHQDTEVITQVGTGDAQRPHTRDDEDISGEEETTGGVLDGRRLEDVERGLVPEGLLVEVVADYTEREDYYREEVASVAGVAAEELGQDSVVVF